MKNDSWSLRSFDNLIEIGKGSFSKVFRATEIISQKQVALKMISIESSKKLNYLNRVIREVDTQYMIDYHLIVKVFGTF